MSSSGIIGPYFFEDALGNAVTVTSERYAYMLENFFTPQLAQYDVNEETFFQQDGATSHTARVSMNIVNGLFPNHERLSGMGLLEIYRGESDHRQKCECGYCG
jgi:hypothetical protein